MTDEFTQISVMPKPGELERVSDTVVEIPAGTVLPAGAVSEIVPDNREVAPIAGNGQPVPTPENTPIPGGGSWHWNSEKGGWDENTTPYAPPAV